MTKPALLMLLSRHPYAEHSGRALMLRQRLEQARRRFDVRAVVLGRAAGDDRDGGLTFLPMAGPLGVAANAIALADAPLQTWLYNSRAARARVAELAAGASAIYIDMLRLAPLAEDVPRNVTRVMDFDDLLSERYRLAASNDYDVMGFLGQRMGVAAQAARLVSKPLLRAEARRCEVYERALVERSDLVLMTSEHETQALGAPRAIAAPPMMRPLAHTPAPGRRLIFLGNMRYAENVTMLRALAEGVRVLREDGAWPADAVIEVIGDHPADLSAKFDGRDFRFRGRVAELASLAGAGIFLAPVVSGSGVKIKVLDGMALGCPVVATPKALEGLSARPNHDLLVAATPTGALRAALELRDRERLKQMLAARARAYLERAHSDAIGDALCDAIEAAIRRRQETL
jgi:hypothetical protein